MDDAFVLKVSDGGGVQGQHGVREVSMEGNEVRGARVCKFCQAQAIVGKRKEEAMPRRIVAVHLQQRVYSIQINLF